EFVITQAFIYRYIVSINGTFEPLTVTRLRLRLPVPIAAGSVLLKPRGACSSSGPHPGGITDRAWNVGSLSGRTLGPWPRTEIHYRTRRLVECRRPGRKERFASA